MSAPAFNGRLSSSDVTYGRNCTRGFPSTTPLWMFFSCLRIRSVIAPKTYRCIEKHSIEDFALLLLSVDAFWFLKSSSEVRCSVHCD